MQVELYPEGGGSAGISNNRQRVGAVEMTLASYRLFESYIILGACVWTQIEEWPVSIRDIIRVALFKLLPVLISSVFRMEQIEP